MRSRALSCVSLSAQALYQPAGRRNLWHRPRRIEAILVLGLTAINNIAIAQLVNSGSIETITNGLTGAQLDQVQAQIAAVASFGAANLLLGLAERAIAMTLHISLSVVVFRAVRQRKAGYLGLAVALHALFDVPAALFQCGVLHSTWLVEALLLVLCLGCAAYAKSSIVHCKNRNSRRYPIRRKADLW